MKAKPATQRRLTILLRRIRQGECPRCSHVVFEQLRALVPYLQLESIYGADTRAGYHVVPLRSVAETDAAIDAYFKGD